MKQKKYPSNIKRELSSIEHIVDKTIPFLVVLLALLIIADFTMDIHKFEPWVSYADWLIVGFFVIDLSFKWRHVRKVTKFLKLYWLDILAVFPFYLIFRAYVAIADIIVAGERIKEAQQIAHEAVLLRETKLLKEAELFTKETRLVREAELAAKEAKFVPRMIRFGQRLIRFVWGSLHVTHGHLVLASKKQIK
ncbi:hypothetical protein HY484_00855 [Candidatus Woesearchaeota archaeon]|nr:hypothetical protein [Candidatus Woesearchaeota archaeon]